jgi:hypothetical protein
VTSRLQSDSRVRAKSDTVSAAPKDAPRSLRACRPHFLCCRRAQSRRVGRSFCKNYSMSGASGVRRGRKTLPFNATVLLAAITMKPCEGSPLAFDVAPPTNRSMGGGDPPYEFDRSIGSMPVHSAVAAAHARQLQSSGCADTNSNCPGWAASRFCLSTSQYYSYMMNTCPVSCNACPPPSPASPPSVMPPRTQPIEWHTPGY